MKKSISGDPELKAKAVQNLSFEKALKRAEGGKVLDDESRLKKMQKKRNQKKVKYDAAVLP